MKTLKPVPMRPIITAGFSGAFWSGLALLISSLVLRATGGTVTGTGTWLLTAAGAVGGAVGGWYTQPLLTWFAGAIRSNKPSNRP